MTRAMNHALLLLVALAVTAACGRSSASPARAESGAPSGGHATPATPASARSAAAAPAAPLASPVAPATSAGATPARLAPELPPVPERPSPGYEARGRRDPFLAPEEKTAPSGLTVASTRLTGIVQSPHASLALVEAPDGIGYILRTGDTLGDGRLVEIGADTIVFAVAPRPGSSTNRVVLRLAAN
jgi:Tfp pilus assembly protein PilP